MPLRKKLPLLHKGHPSLVLIFLFDPADLEGSFLALNLLLEIGVDEPSYHELVSFTSGITNHDKEF